MIIKAIKAEWFQDYKVPSMYIAFPTCSFKCEKECGKKMCQNSHLATLPVREVSIDSVIQTYLGNPITQSIVCGGLEPFEQFFEMFDLIFALRNNYHCNDTVVIYTGYNKDEIAQEVEALKRFPNIIIKFGRFVPNQSKHYDEVLGVNLASDNQYAEVIS